MSKYPRLPTAEEFLDSEDDPLSGLDASPDDPFERVKGSIITQESGGRYDAVGKPTKYGRALGKYQIIPPKVREWSRKHVGREVTPDEFLRSPELQDQIAHGALREYWDQALADAGGDHDVAARRTAAAWYSGNPNLYKNKDAQSGGPSIAEYSQSVATRAQGGGGPKAPTPQAAPTAEEFLDAPDDAVAEPTSKHFARATRKAQQRETKRLTKPQDIAAAQELMTPGGLIGAVFGTEAPPPEAEAPPRVFRDASGRHVARGPNGELYGFDKEGKPKLLSDPHKTGAEIAQKAGRDEFARKLARDREAARASGEEAAMAPEFASREQQLRFMDAELAKQQNRTAIAEHRLKESTATGRRQTHHDLERAAAGVKAEQEQGYSDIAPDLGTHALEFLGSYTSGPDVGTGGIPEQGPETRRPTDFFGGKALADIGRINRRATRDLEDRYAVDPYSGDRGHVGRLADIIRAAGGPALAAGAGAADAVESAGAFLPSNPLEAGSSLVAGLTGVQNHDPMADTRFLALSPRAREEALKRREDEDLIPSLVGGILPYTATALLGPFAPAGAAAIGAAHAEAGFYGNPAGTPGTFNPEAAPEQNEAMLQGAMGSEAFAQASMIGGGHLAGMGAAKLGIGSSLAPALKWLTERATGAGGAVVGQLSYDVAKNAAEHGPDPREWAFSGQRAYLIATLLGASMGARRPKPLYLADASGRIGEISPLGETRVLGEGEVPKGPVVDFRSAAPFKMSFDAVFSPEGGAQPGFRGEIYSGIRGPAARRATSELPDLERVVRDPDGYRIELLGRAQAAESIGRFVAGEPLSAKSDVAQIMVAEDLAARDRFPDLAELAQKDPAALAREAAALRQKAAGIDEALLSPHVAGRHADELERQAVSLETDAATARETAEHVREASDGLEAQATAAERAHEDSSRAREGAEQQLAAFKDQIAESVAAGREVRPEAVHVANQIAGEVFVARKNELERQAAALEARRAADDAAAEHATYDRQAKDLETRAKDAEGLRARGQERRDQAEKALAAGRGQDKKALSDPKTRAAIEAEVAGHLANSESKLGERGSAAAARIVVNVADGLGRSHGIDPEAPLAQRVAAVSDILTGERSLTSLFHDLADDSPYRAAYDVESGKVFLGRDANALNVPHELLHAVRLRKLLDPATDAAMTTWARAYYAANREAVLRANPALENPALSERQRERYGVEEVLAGALEGYLHEGRLPSGAQAVEGAFADLAAIGREIYKPVFASHLVDPAALPADIRAMFDRLVGADLVNASDRVVDQKKGEWKAAGAETGAPVAFTTPDADRLYALGARNASGGYAAVKPEVEALAKELGTTVPEARRYLDDQFRDFRRQMAAAEPGTKVDLEARLPRPGKDDSSQVLSLKATTRMQINGLLGTKPGTKPRPALVETAEREVAAALSSVLGRPALTSDVDRHLAENMPAEWFDRAAVEHPDQAEHWKALKDWGEYLRHTTAPKPARPAATLPQVKPEAAKAGGAPPEGRRGPGRLSDAEWGEMSAAEQRRYAEGQRSLAHTDPLTGLGNRRALEHTVEEIQQRTGREPTVTAIDANALKLFNDYLGGHQAGDWLLTKLAESLKGTGIEAFRGGTNGDEFYLVSDRPAEEHQAAAEAALEELRAHQFGPSTANGDIHLPDGSLIPKGSTIVIDGATFSHGTDAGLEAADARLTADKHAREGTDRPARGPGGEPADRGAVPPGLSIRVPETARGGARGAEPGRGVDAEAGGAGAPEPTGASLTTEGPGRAAVKVDLKPLPKPSSNLAAMGFDPASGTIAVQYKGGAVYHYPATAAEFAEAQAADSIGSWVSKNLRTRVGTTKVAAPRETHRSWSAGTNRGSVEFADSVQRRLFDLGAELRRAAKGGQNKTSERANKNIPGLTADLTAELGLDPKAVHELAYQTHDDVRDQMKGLKDGEARTVTDNVRREEAAPAARPTPAALSDAASVRARIEKLKTELANDRTPGAEERGRRVVENFPLSDLATDPERFQYKIGFGEEGQTDSLKGVEEWNPDLAGFISAWRDPVDGKVYVVNGHNRYALAKRLGVKDLAVRFLEATTPAEARAKGALANMAEGQGTAIDAATFLRDSKFDEAQARRMLPLSKATVRDGLALARLDKTVFDMVKRGDLPEAWGVDIAERLPNPDLQSQAAKILAKAKDEDEALSAAEVSEVLDSMTSAPTMEWVTGSLFGDQTHTRSLIVERAQVAASIRREIASDKSAFGGAAKNAQRLERVGEIDKEQASKIAAESRDLLGAFDRLKGYTGDVAEVLNDAATRIGAGEKAAAVKRDAYQKIRPLLAAALEAGPEARVGGLPDGPGAEGTPPRGPGGEDVEGGGSLFAPGYHGTPHEFERFSLHAIGTGEGHQAYGWGLYFSGEPAVARAYRERLADRRGFEALTPEESKVLPNWVANSIAGRLADPKQGEQAARRELDEMIADFEGRVHETRGQIARQEGQYWIQEGHLPGLERIVEALQKLKDSPTLESRPGGSLYKAEIPDDHEYLDGDKFLFSQPPEILAKLKNAGLVETEEAQPEWGDLGTPDAAWKQTGLQFYRGLERRLGGPRKASEALSKLGIPGLRYRDQQSRGKDSGTSNYVVWDESLIGPPERLEAPGAPKAAGFFSPTERAVEKVFKYPLWRMKASAVLGALERAGAKPEEIRDLGLDEYLKERGHEPVTVYDLQNLLKANRLEVEEVTLAKPADHGLVAYFDHLEPQERAAVNADLKAAGVPELDAPEWAGDTLVADPTTIRKAIGVFEHYDLDMEELGAAPGEMQAEGAAAFEEQTEPGGDHYREVLLKLPGSLAEVQKHNAELQELGKLSDVLEAGEYDKREAAIRRKRDEASKVGSVNDYNSSHYPEHTNILAHVRLKDETTGDGVKTLRVEEIQSDWQQTGKKEGFRDSSRPPFSEELKAAADRLEASEETWRRLSKEVHDSGYWAMSDESLAARPDLLELNQKKAEAEAESDRIRQEILDINRQRGREVPDAPMKQSWHQFALKRILRMAVDGDYDAIRLTTGETQAKRYGLDKHLDSLIYEPGAGGLYGSRDGKQVFKKGNVKPEALPDIVGKEVAERLLAAPGGTDELGNTVHRLDGQDLKLEAKGQRVFYDERIPAFLNKFGKPYGAKVTEDGAFWRFPVTDEMREALRKPLPLYAPGAPKADGFYSPTDRAVDRVFQTAGAVKAESLLNQLQRAGAKPEEIADLGLDEYVRSRRGAKIGREELQTFVDANRLNVREITKKEGRAAVRLEIFPPEEAFDEEVGNHDDWFDRVNGDLYQANLPDMNSSEWHGDRFIGDPGVAHEIARIFDKHGAGTSIEDDYETPGAARYNTQDLVEPGGANYREILMTLPERAPKVPKGQTLSRMADGEYVAAGPDGVGRRLHTTDEAEATSEAARQAGELPQPFRHGHWDEPNVFAHMRVSDETTDRGARQLRVEELQSDWLQSGKKEGFRGTKPPTLPDYKIVSGDEMPENPYWERRWLGDEYPFTHAVLDARTGRGLTWVKSQAEAEQFVRQNAQYETNVQARAGVPDVPMKDSWHEFALKRILRMAVDGGYSAVRITKGETQAKRYSLDKHIDRLEWDDGGWLRGERNGEIVFQKAGVKEEDLPGIVGEEVTARLLATKESDPLEGDLYTLKGNDLKVEAKGMRTFYDEKVPGFLNRYLKQYNAKVVDDGAFWKVEINDAVREGLSGPQPLYAPASPAKRARRASEQASDEATRKGLLSWLGSSAVKVVRTARESGKAFILMNPATDLTNTTSNSLQGLVTELKDSQAALLDRVVGKRITGKRSRTWSLRNSLDAAGVALSWKDAPDADPLDRSRLTEFKRGGLRKGLLDLRLIPKTDTAYRTEEAPEPAALEMGKRGIFPKLSEKSAAGLATRFNQHVFSKLEAADALLFTYSLRKNFGDAALASAYNDGLKGKEARARRAELMQSPTQDLVEMATAAALSDTFKNSTKPHQMIKALREVAGDGLPGEATKLVLDMLFPFSQTPSSILVKGFDLIGGSAGRVVVDAVKIRKLIKEGALDDFDKAPEVLALQRHMTEHAGNALTGAEIFAGVLLTGIAAGARGIIEPLTSEEDDKARSDQRLQGLGFTGGRIKLGGYTFDLGNAGPFGTVLLAAAGAGQAYRRNHSWGGAAYASLAQAVLVFFDSPLMQGPHELWKGGTGLTLNALSTDERTAKQGGRDLARYGASLAGRFVPGSSALGAVARATDVDRKADTFTDMMKMNIPGLRKTLPLKDPNPITGEQEQGRGLLNFAPFSPQKFRGNDPAIRVAVDFDLQPPDDTTRKGEDEATAARRNARRKEVWREALRVYAPDYAPISKDLPPDERKRLGKELRERINDYVDERLKAEFPLPKRSQ